MQSVCVFCGSSSGNDARLARAAHSFGKLLAQAQCRLVYGGGSVGLMGELANAALKHGGEVIGVIPRALAERELAHPGLTRLYEVETMHERKALMAAHAQGFVALPGGLGTFEEFFEVFTWAQLGYHQKPLGVLDVEGFFAPFLELLGHLQREGFVQKRWLEQLVVEADGAHLLARLRERCQDGQHA